ncbi:MAG TPA: hypothetical protein VL996_04515 [Methylocella sp.]|nr:hypothetical protein [Methylocella sp.]
MAILPTWLASGQPAIRRAAGQCYKTLRRFASRDLAAQLRGHRLLAATDAAARET